MTRRHRRQGAYPDFRWVNRQDDDRQGALL